jgi:hypothetical protein
MRIAVTILVLSGIVLLISTDCMESSIKGMGDKERSMQGNKK